MPTETAISEVVATAIPANIEPEAIVGSPFKKQRSSLPGFDESVRKKLGLDAIAGNVRRESESAASSTAGLSAFPSTGVSSWSVSSPESGGTKTFEAGGSSVAKSGVAEQDMEEEL